MVGDKKQSPGSLDEPGYNLPLGSMIRLFRSKPYLLALTVFLTLLALFVTNANLARAAKTVVNLTSTLTRTPTSTPEGAYPSPVESPYPSPVESPYPGPIQSPFPTLPQTPYPGTAVNTTPVATLTGAVNTTTTNQLQPAGIPTSTLRPFPNITIEIPDATQTPPVTEQPTPEPGDSSLAGWVNMARLGPLALILLIWVLLGGWFYLTLRHME